VDCAAGQFQFRDRKNPVDSEVEIDHTHGPAALRDMRQRQRRACEMQVILKKRVTTIGEYALCAPGSFSWTPGDGPIGSA
jgi:hypothetical protein